MIPCPITQPRKAIGVEAPLLDRVVGVVPVCTQKDVSRFRAYTRRVVTTVTREQPVWNWAVRQLPRNAMGQLLFVCGVRANLAVSCGRRMPNPEPTGGRFTDVLPEPHGKGKAAVVVAARKRTMQTAPPRNPCGIGAKLLQAIQAGLKDGHQVPPVADVLGGVVRVTPRCPAVSWSVA